MNREQINSLTGHFKLSSGNQRWKGKCVLNKQNTVSLVIVEQ